MNDYDTAKFLFKNQEIKISLPYFGFANPHEKITDLICECIKKDYEKADKEMDAKTRVNGTITFTQEAKIITDYRGHDAEFGYMDKRPNGIEPRNNLIKGVMVFKVEFPECESCQKKCVDCTEELYKAVNMAARHLSIKAEKEKQH
ncbi:MAG: hypothetical protein FWG80_01235 [Alphaproteobacteria bacterium]|nr:hypothetical protein [Alphaproteobacteria bacterium]